VLFQELLAQHAQVAVMPVLHLFALPVLMDILVLVPQPVLHAPLQFQTAKSARQQQHAQLAAMDTIPQAQLAAQHALQVVQTVVPLVVTVPHFVLLVVALLVGTSIQQVHAHNALQTVPVAKITVPQQALLQLDYAVLAKPTTH